VWPGHLVAGRTRSRGSIAATRACWLGCVQASLSPLRLLTAPPVLDKMSKKNGGASRARRR
jgi:hypothetical protein